MSATDWSICPICKKEKEAKINKGIHVEDNEYLHPEHETEETVREDYEIYFDKDGNYVFEGRAECELCGMTWIADGKKTIRIKGVKE